MSAKRGYVSAKRYSWPPLISANKPYIFADISTKEPYISAKERCVSTKTTYVSAKQLRFTAVILQNNYSSPPLICATEPCISQKVPYVSAQEPYASAKETYISAKEPHVSAKNSCWHLVPVICQMLERTVMFTEEPYISARMYLQTISVDI